MPLRVAHAAAGPAASIKCSKHCAAYHLMKLSRGHSLRAHRNRHTRSPGVQSYDVSLEKQQVVVRGNVTPEAVLETVKKTGKKAELVK